MVAKLIKNEERNRKQINEQHQQTQLRDKVTLKQSGHRDESNEKRDREGISN